MARLGVFRAATLLGLIVAFARLAPASAEPPVAARVEGSVARVADGDTVTIRLPEGLRLVRLIGVDAPEVHDSPRLRREVERSRLARATITAMGRAARDFVEARLLGRQVSLEYDVEHHDRYGRLLAYVWLPDGTLFNAELVRAGYARPYTVPPNVRYVARLRALGEEARQERRGLWNDGLEALAPRRPVRARGRRASLAPAARTSPDLPP